jgi:hypothetical protein
MSLDVLDHPLYKPELMLCGLHVFGPPQEGAKGPKVKSGQRQWYGGTLIVTAAVRDFSVEGSVVWCISGSPVTTPVKTTANGLYSFIHNITQICFI